MLDMMIVLHELLRDLKDKPDPSLNYIKALELAIEEINNNGDNSVRFENQYMSTCN